MYWCKQEVGRVRWVGRDTGCRDDNNKDGTMRDLIDQLLMNLMLVLSWGTEAGEY